MIVFELILKMTEKKFTALKHRDNTSLGFNLFVDKDTKEPLFFETKQNLDKDFLDDFFSSKSIANNELKDIFEENKIIEQLLDCKDDLNVLVNIIEENKLSLEQFEEIYFLANMIESNLMKTNNNFFSFKMAKKSFNTAKQQFGNVAIYKILQNVRNNIKKLKQHIEKIKSKSNKFNNNLDYGEQKVELENVSLSKPRVFKL